jgi:hypothetical protein
MEARKEYFASLVGVMGHEDNFNLIVKENDNHFPGARRSADSPDRLAVDMRARNTPIICPEKVLL